VEWTVLLNLTSTLIMVGVIWFVQIVHYPLMKEVGPSKFTEYETLHQRLTTYVVFPPMVVELVTSIYLCFHPPTGSPQLLWWIGAFLVLGLWTSTFLVQVPLHKSLMDSYNDRNLNTLIQSNWVRTIAWSLRAVIVWAAYHY